MAYELPRLIIECAYFGTAEDEKPWEVILGVHISLAEILPEPFLDLCNSVLVGQLGAQLMEDLLLPELGLSVCERSCLSSFDDEVEIRQQPGKIFLGPCNSVRRVRSRHT